jgi:uncharacterized membrane protein YfcA
MSKKNRVISINRGSRRGRVQRHQNRLTMMIGVLAGSLTGARVLAGANVHVVRIVFAIVIDALGIQMIDSRFAGRI